MVVQLIFSLLKNEIRNHFPLLYDEFMLDVDNDEKYYAMPLTIQKRQLYIIYGESAFHNNLYRYYIVFNDGRPVPDDYYFRILDIINLYDALISYHEYYKVNGYFPTHEIILQFPK